VDYPAEQALADAGAADGDDADPLARAEAQLRAESLARAELLRIETGHVPREVVVLLGPVADPRQPGAERVRDDVVGLADEDRAVAKTRVAGDVLDHLGVVVGGKDSCSPPSGLGS